MIEKNVWKNLSDQFEKLEIQNNELKQENKTLKDTLQGCIKSSYPFAHCNIPAHNILIVDNAILKDENKALKDGITLANLKNEQLQNVIKDLQKMIDTETHKNKRLKIVLYINFALSFIVLIAAAIVGSGK